MFQRESKLQQLTYTKRESLAHIASEAEKGSWTTLNWLRDIGAAEPVEKNKGAGEIRPVSLCTSNP